MCSDKRSTVPVIAVRDLSKSFGVYRKPHYRFMELMFPGIRKGDEFRALSEVSFDVLGGETIGVIGRNGAGKSTLLQLITGVLTPSSGSINVQGRVAALLELGAGFNPEFTGRENAIFNAGLLGLSQEEITQRFDDIVEFSELGEFIDQAVKTYSSGMYVRLAFSVAIHTDPSVLIVDEALAVGDARFQAKCMDRIEQIKEKGATILFVSHDVMAIRQLCSRALWLDSGRIAMMGDVVSVTSAYTRALFEQDPGGRQLIPDIDDEMQAVSFGDYDRGWDGDPLSHWGKSVGLINFVDIQDSNGRSQRVFENGEDVRVLVRWRGELLPPGSDVGVAFSIKDVNGADLIVGSTWDTGLRFDSLDEIIEVRFQLPLGLAPGEYMLVAAIEDRDGTGIEYHEYIEGACYFATAYDKIVHGAYVPPMTCQIRNLEG